MLRNGLEPWHLVIVLVVVFMLFGAKRMPDTARALGKSLRILKSETRALKDDFKDGVNGTEKSATTAESTADAPKTIKAAPGESVGARQVPVTEPAKAKS
jgi:sec-independent protein translocase protein TatA